MGCWNATCMISGLPIIDADPVVAYIIKENVKFSIGSSPSFSPVSPPIRGMYDNYGGIEGFDKDSLAVLLASNSRDYLGNFKSVQSLLITLLNLLEHIITVRGSQFPMLLWG